MEPIQISNFCDTNGEYLYTAEYLSFFLVNLFRMLGADPDDINSLNEYLELNSPYRVQLTRLPKQ